MMNFTQTNIFEGLTPDQVQEECAILCSNYMNASIELLKTYHVPEKDLQKIMANLLNISTLSFKSGFCACEEAINKSVNELFDTLEALDSADGDPIDNAMDVLNRLDPKNAK